MVNMGYYTEISNVFHLIVGAGCLLMAGNRGGEARRFFFIAKDRQKLKLIDALYRRGLRLSRRTARLSGRQSGLFDL
jgi:hypothetical protein